MNLAPLDISTSATEGLTLFDLQRMVREVYLSAAEYDENLHVVDCSTSEQSMAAPEVISAKIKDIITRYMR